MGIRTESIQISDDDILIEPNDKKSCCGGRNLEKKEKEIKIIFFGNNEIEKEQIIQAIVGNNKKIKGDLKNKKNINEYENIYKLDNKQVINTKIFTTNEKSIESKDLKNIIKHCRIYFLVFNMNKKDNFKGLNKWINKIKEYHDLRKNFVNILGIKSNNNKEDNEGITAEQGEKIAKKLGANFEVVTMEEKSSLQNLVINNLESYLKFYE